MKLCLKRFQFDEQSARKKSLIVWRIQGIRNKEMGSYIGQFIGGDTRRIAEDD